jgi:hypothetical protein
LRNTCWIGKPNNALFATPTLSCLSLLTIIQVLADAILDGLVLLPAASKDIMECILENVAIVVD